MFVKPSALQLSIFAKILQQDSLNSLIRGSTARTLALINNLTKISNSPILLQLKDDETDKNEDDSVRGSEPIREAMKLLPQGANHHNVSLSGQHHVLIALFQRDLTAGDSDRQTCCVGEYLERNSQGEHLRDPLFQLVSPSSRQSASSTCLIVAMILGIWFFDLSRRCCDQDTDEKCIIVSHYTSTLDMIQAFCEKKKYTYNRLDGCVVCPVILCLLPSDVIRRTQASKRQEYVDGFNKSSQSNCCMIECHIYRYN